MKSKKNRLISWLLLSAMVVGMTACNGGEVEETEPVETIDVSETAELPENEIFDLPTDLD